MNTVLRFVGVTALLLAGFAANAQAGERGPKAKGEGPKAGKPMGPPADLNLTPEQKQKMDKIHEAASKQAEPLHKEMAAKMKEMQPLWAVDKPDRAAIERKHAEMSAIQNKLWGIHIDAKLQIHALLTPEQRSKWADDHDAGPGMPGMHVDECPCMHGSECPCMHGGECPCMHGAGPGKGPDGPGGSGGPGKGPKPEKK